MRPHSLIVALFDGGRHEELENRARSLLARHPDSGFTWKVLGARLLIQSKDCLPALLNATIFSPGDADAHYNLGNHLRVLGRPVLHATLRQAGPLNFNAQKAFYVLLHGKHPDCRNDAPA